MNIDFTAADLIAERLEASRIASTISDKAIHSFVGEHADFYPLIDELVSKAAEELGRRAAESINHMLCSQEN